MSNVIDFKRSKFSIGDLVRHRKFGYLGVIYDVDPSFQLSDEWYDTMAKTKPPRDKPWYHVLVHDASHTTYVAERNLEPNDRAEPIDHPLIEEYFSDFKNGRYVPILKSN